VWDSGSITGAFSRCFNKPQGVTAVQVEVTGSSGASWSYTLECDACPPPAVAPPCCRDRGAVCDGGVTVRYCSPAPPPDTSPCANSSSLPECDTATCTATGVNPSFFPPYDCVNGAFAFGAWVSVSGWSAADPSETDPDVIALYAEADSKVNQTFFVPFTCFGSATKTFNLGAGAGANRTTAGTSCVGPSWVAVVSVNLCARTASVAVRNDNCWDPTDINVNLSDLTAITVACNSWTGCDCAAFSSSNAGSGGGTVSVS
jgi:hypothetical protein